MTLTDYFSTHLNGAWRLLWGDQSALESFDLSAQGFFRSFWAIAAAFALMVPVLAGDHRMGMAFAAETENVHFAMPLGVYVVTEVVVAIMGWAVFLMLMVPVTRQFGVADRYGTYVIAYNWASLLIVCLNLPLAAAELTGLARWDLALAAQFILGLIFLVYSWFIAVAALRLKGLDALAVVALETLIFVILAYPTEELYALYVAPAAP